MRVGVQTPRGFESRHLVFGLDVAEWLKALWGLPHFPCHLFARNLSSEKLNTGRLVRVIVGSTPISLLRVARGEHFYSNVDFALPALCPYS